MNARYAAAIDLSGRSAGFALMKDQELLCAASRPMRGRDSAELADFVAQQLAANGVELAEVSDWTVGSGPGSFTGLRLAAALAAGWTFGKEGCAPAACRPLWRWPPGSKLPMAPGSAAFLTAVTVS